MYISAASIAYVEKVLNNNNLMAIGTCTEAMQGVMAFLGQGVAVPIAEFNAAQDGMYSLTLNFCGDINTSEHIPGFWEHGIALQKIGGDLVLYQAWVGSFTLGDWLLAAHNVCAYPAVAYSPLHANCSESAMKNWLGMLLTLGKLATGNFAAFKATVQFVFGPPSDGTAHLQLITAAGQKRALRYHWKHAPLKAIGAV
jgi:hypothetical protein